MRLLLIFTAWGEDLGSFKNAAKKVLSFPLNLAIVAAVAEKSGWEVQIIDAQVDKLSIDGIISKIELFSFDLVGLTATTPSFHTACDLAIAIKKRFDIPLAIGGTHVSILKEKAFAEYFDYLFIGECETILPEFLEKFAAKEEIVGIKGVMHRYNNKIVFSGNAPMIENLDDVPFPARHLLNNEKYLLGTGKGLKRYAAIQMSRGCPFSCVFCANDLHGKKYRLRSVSNIVEELETVINKFGAKHIFFVDDVLTLNKRHLLELCEQIEKRNLIFTFEGSTRADLIDEDLVKKLHDCGLIRISFGLETADSKVREIIKKGVPLNSYSLANKICNKYGIETINSVIIGLPGDNQDSIERTINYLCKARDLQHVTLNIAIPYPGTELLRMAENCEHGLNIVERDFVKYQRYDSAVMEVNGISPAKLIELQKKGLIRIYSCWWRIIPVIKRFGFCTVIVTGLRTLAKLFLSTWNLRENR